MFRAEAGVVSLFTSMREMSSMPVMAFQIIEAEGEWPPLPVTMISMRSSPVD